MRELDFDFLREKFSPEAQQVISVSIEESRRRNHNFLSEDHILLALCKEEPELLKATLCNDSLRLQQLISQITLSVDSIKPHVGRSLRMTPELKRTIRTACENIFEMEERQIESFDLLSAIEKNKTSSVWKIIKPESFSEAEFQQHLAKYRIEYLHQKKYPETGFNERLTEESSYYIDDNNYASVKKTSLIWYGSIFLLSAIVALSLAILFSTC